MTNQSKNRYHGLIQEAIGEAGDRASQLQHLIKRMKDFRQYPDSLLEGDLESQFIEDMFLIAKLCDWQTLLPAKKPAGLPEPKEGP